MANLVDEGLGLMHTAGQKVQDGVNAVHKREQHSAWSPQVIGLAASVAGAVAAFFVSKMVRSQLSQKH